MSTSIKVMVFDKDGYKEEIDCVRVRDRKWAEYFLNLVIDLQNKKIDFELISSFSLLCVGTNIDKTELELLISIYKCLIENIGHYLKFELE